MRKSARQWAELVAAWTDSGTSASTFAGERGVAEASLRWWKGELARRARREAPRRSPGPGRHRRGPAVALARVVREGASPASSAPPRASLVVEVGRATIVVERDFDAALLRAVVHALEEEP